jgi:hypothetical protein
VTVIHIVLCWTQTLRNEMCGVCFNYNIQYHILSHATDINVNPFFCDLLLTTVNFHLEIKKKKLM